jgi:sugar phosphate isomerase/epimerase
VAFTTANYIGRQLGYAASSWMLAEVATAEYFAPLVTFRERFGQLLGDIRALGVDRIEIYQAHLDPHWASESHASTARELLLQHNLPLSNLSGDFLSDGDTFLRASILATRLGTRLLVASGSMDLLTSDRAWVIAVLEERDLVLALENHKELTPADLMAKVGAGEAGRIRVAIDTGWWGTQGFDAVEAIKALYPHVVHVHLKDVTAAGAHKTVRFGQGCVPVEGCVRMLRQYGYPGIYTVEHEPLDCDPTDDCASMVQLVQEWLS